MGVWVDVVFNFTFWKKNKKCISRKIVVCMMWYKCLHWYENLRVSFMFLATWCGIYTCYVHEDGKKQTTTKAAISLVKWKSRLFFCFILVLKNHSNGCAIESCVILNLCTRVLRIHCLNELRKLTSIICKA